MSNAQPNLKQTGRDGERLAAEYLKSLGYQIVATNYRPPMKMWPGEIDIVASDGPILCFVEVKTRRHRRAEPEEAVTPAKRRQLIGLAEAYLSLTETPDDVVCRFDVVAITAPFPGQSPQIVHFKNAFWPE